jgi:nicotinate-nucleotide pyrophosphorylase (carboxylating)
MAETDLTRALDEIIERALQEDIGDGDVTTLATIPAARIGKGYFLAKEDGVLAGLEVVSRVFAVLDDRVHVTWSSSDGEAVQAGTRFGAVAGPARVLLSGERVALNLMQRMSGIATAARAMSDAARPARLLDTRKTAPGLRMLDKWAVRIGGAHNHRTGLYDRFLIKDNHITACGGIAAAIEAALRYRKENASGLLVEVETRTLDEVDEVISAGGVDWILLDNMVRMHDDGLIDVSLLQEAVRRVGGRFKTEASGNVTIETVDAIAATGVDYVSSGALTHSVRALDISLKLTLEEHTSLG